MLYWYLLEYPSAVFPNLFFRIKTTIVKLLDLKKIYFYTNFYFYTLLNAAIKQENLSFLYEPKVPKQ